MKRGVKKDGVKKGDVNKSHVNKSHVNKSHVDRYLPSKENKRHALVVTTEDSGSNAMRFDLNLKALKTAHYDVINQRKSLVFRDCDWKHNLSDIAIVEQEQELDTFCKKFISEGIPPHTMTNIESESESKKKNKKKNKKIVSMDIIVIGHGGHGLFFTQEGCTSENSVRQDAEFKMTELFSKLIKKLSNDYLKLRIDVINLHGCFTATEYVNLELKQYFNSPARMLSALLDSTPVMGVIGKHSTIYTHGMYDEKRECIKRSSLSKSAIIFVEGKAQNFLDAIFYTDHEYTPGFIREDIFDNAITDKKHLTKIVLAKEILESKFDLMDADWKDSYGSKQLMKIEESKLKEIPRKGGDDSSEELKEQEEDIQTRRTSRRRP